MTNLRSPAPSANITPVHQRLLDNVEALRALAAPIVARFRKVPHVRPDSPEAVYLRFLAFVLEDAEMALSMARKYGGRLEIVFQEDSARRNLYRIIHRDPPAKVTDLKEYRLARAQRAAS